VRARIVYGPAGKKTYYLGDKEVTEAEFAASGRKHKIADLLGTAGPGGTATSGWPMRSEAMAVHPSQIEQARRRNKRLGVGNVDYDTRTGQAIIPDAATRKRLMRAEGFFCKHSFC